MRLRQEQTVFVLVLVVLGAMAWGLLRGALEPRGGSRSGNQAELTHYRAPDVAVAVPNESRPALRRELFSPPRDTRALPPLEFVEPAMLPLANLIPPTDPGPAPRAYGRWLRRAVAPIEAPGLFSGRDDEAEAEEEPLDDPSVDPRSAGPTPPRSVNQEPTVQELLAQLSGKGEDPFKDETPAEREARYAGYRKQYDWIRLGPGQYLFGRIDNEARYGLEADASRANEPLEFVEVNPVTGKAKLASVGAPAQIRTRDQFADFGFADTVANEIEVRRLLVHEPLTRGGFDQAMSLADYAVRVRHEAPRALAMAEELYRLCIAYDAKDFAPRLGLTHALEAGFRFEEAFAEYQLLIDAFPGRAEPLVRLALLEEKFLLATRAEERLRRAFSIDGGNWEARLGLGAFLARHGRLEEAVPHLRAAVRFAPSEPELLHVRVGNRVALADALLALGEVSEARSVYEQAAAADSTHQRARAGVLVTDLLLMDAEGASTTEASTPPEPAADEQGEGYELVLVRGVRAILDGEPEAARDSLLAAVEADPLRASTPLAALAFLALATGNDADAMSYAEEAIERDPRNAYAYYLKGRMLGRQDDYEGAREALIAALDREVDFEDALVALGEMAFRLGRFEDAERYLQRAVSIDATRPEVHALRGTNFLRLGSVPDARAAFAAGLELEPNQPEAKGGKAWCAYLDGDVTEGLKLLADLDDARRAMPEDDPWRLWAREQIERIRDHVEMVEWTDNFNRTRLINGWMTREGDGPTVGMRDGAVKIEGQFDKLDGKAQVYREYIASEFVSFSASVRVSADAVRAGIFIAREQQRRGASDVMGEASVSRHQDGSLQLRFIRQGQPVTVVDMEQSFPVDRWVRLAIRREGVSSDTTVTILMDGIPLMEDVSLPSVGSANSPLLIGLFAEGASGRACLVEMDEAAVVYRGNR